MNAGRISKVFSTLFQLNKVDIDDSIHKMFLPLSA